MSTNDYTAYLAHFGTFTKKEIAMNADYLEINGAKHKLNY